MVRDYVATYLERDVRQLLAVQDWAFQRFVRLCAGRTGQLLNLSALANECGVAHNTVRGSGSRCSRRVTWSCWSGRITPTSASGWSRRRSCTSTTLDWRHGSWGSGERALETHPLRGALFETMVVSEFVKSRFNSGDPPTSISGGTTTATRPTCCSSPRAGACRRSRSSRARPWCANGSKGLAKWQTLAWAEQALPGWLIYGGDEASTAAKESRYSTGGASPGRAVPDRRSLAAELGRAQRAWSGPDCRLFGVGVFP